MASTHRSCLWMIGQTCSTPIHACKQAFSPCIMQSLQCWPLMAGTLLQLQSMFEGTPAAYCVRLQVFSGKHSTRTEEEVITNAALQQAWRRLQGDSSAGAAEPTEASKPIEGDCAICYDEMHPDGGTLQVPESQEPGCWAGQSHWMKPTCVAFSQFLGVQVHCTCTTSGENQASLS